MTNETIAAIEAALAKATQGEWDVDYFVCRADQSDVDYGETDGRKMKLGDELWRVALSIGPIGIDHNHWAGDYIDGLQEDIDLIVLLKNNAPALLASARDTARLEAEVAAIAEECARQERLAKTYRQAQLTAEEKLRRMTASEQGWRKRCAHLEARIAMSENRHNEQEG